MQKGIVYYFIIESICSFPWQVLGLLWVACYWAVHVSLQPYVIKLILDHVSVNPSFHNIIRPILLYIILSIAATLNFRFYEYVSLKFYPKLRIDIMSKTKKKIDLYPYVFFQNQLTGSLTNKIRDLGQGTREIVQIVFDRFFSHGLALIIACITLMTIHVGLCLILLMGSIILILISVITTKKARLLSHEYSESNSLAVGTLGDSITNVINVRLFTSNFHEDQELNKKLNEAAKKDRNLRWYLLKIMTLQSMITMGMISGCLVLLTFFVHSQNITIGDFALVLTLTLAISDIVWNFSQEISRFSEIYGLVSQGVALLNSEIKVEAKDSFENSKLQIRGGAIYFKKICFNYPNSKLLFNKISFTIRACEKIGLVGYSGSGKSTFVNLILRLFEPSSGQIFIDDQDISQVSEDSLRRSIGVIPQDPVLFHRTLMENIRYGKLEASDADVIEAAKKAHAHEFIMALPKKYDTLVGERGIKLSGGQRQRISIARAILKDAPILIMDEATSALDSVTEILIRDGLFKIISNKTTIIIAHRLSTLLHLDRILVFDQGKIVESGSHKKLLEKKGLYKILWEAQVGGFIPGEIVQKDTDVFVM